MTPEQIDKMPVGRELEEAVAIALGWKWYRHPNINVRMLDNPDERRWPTEDCEEARGDEPRDHHWSQWLPRFSTDIAAAWAVVEEYHMSLHHPDDEEYGNGRWRAFAHRGAEWGEGDAVPLAICRAALLAAGKTVKP